MCVHRGFTDIDDCYPSPCENNGTCIDHVSNYTCSCVPGFQGKNCSIGKLLTTLINLSLNSKVNRNLFLGFLVHSNVLWTSKNSFSYLIKSVLPFSDIDDCDPYPCLNNGSCIDGANNYTCACHPGFEGRNCSIRIFFTKEFITSVFLTSNMNLDNRLLL